MSKADEMFLDYGNENEARKVSISNYLSYGEKSCVVTFYYSDSAEEIDFDGCFKFIRFSESTFDYKIIQAINEKCKELNWL